MTVSPTPVVAAGGIGDERGLAATLALGASGVWCGTVFVATRESNVAEHWRQKILAATEEDNRISRVYTGKRMRVVRNPIVDAWERDKEPTLPMPLQAMLVEGLVWSAEQARMTDYVTVTVAAWPNQWHAEGNQECRPGGDRDGRWCGEDHTADPS